jgi:competence protein ComEC
MTLKKSVVLETVYLQRLKIILQSNFCLIICLISILIAYLSTNYFINTSIYSNETKFKGNVIDYKIDGDLLTFTFKDQEKLLGKYYLKSEDEKNYYETNLKYGSNVMVNGSLTEANDNTIPNTFNYRKYLYYQGIYKIILINSLDLDNNNLSLINKLKNYISYRINKIGDSAYLKAFILGDKNQIDDLEMISYRSLGVTHLFAISGMHIGLFAMIILFVLKKLHIKSNASLIIAVFIIFIYALLTGFPASVRRAFGLYLLITIKKIGKLNIKTIDLLYITVTINLIINPGLLYDIGFLYSVMTTLGLILNSNYLNKGNYFVKLFKVSLIAYLFSLPITINNFYEINLLTPINNLFIVPLVSMVIYPLSLITFIMPILSPIFNLMLNILHNIDNFLLNFNVLNIVIPKLSWYLIIIYYLNLFFILKKRYYYFIAFYFIIYFVLVLFPHLNNNAYVYYLDVGQGDSAILIEPYQKRVIMIDTGGKTAYHKEAWQIRNKEYFLTDNSILFLHSLGIKHLDMLILSHGDNDHMGEAEHLVKNYTVNKVIFNQGADNNLESNLKTYLKSHNIMYSNGLEDELLVSLDTKLYDNENDNSNVIYTKIYNYIFLFMGDASVLRERDIINKYLLTNIDFLKVGHHGSDTSSSKEFINQIQPKYSLISVGKNNRYGHPKESVLDTLKNSKIYRTDADGSIEIKLNKNEYKVSTFPP